MLTAFLLGLGAGVAATPHCLGMCGGFPLHLARSGVRQGAMLRQGLFVFGKSFTYVFLGTLAAALGVVVFKDTSLARWAPALRLIAGSITLMFGLMMLGFRLPPIRRLQGMAESGLVRSVLGPLFVNASPAAAFVLGLGVGFLPCPLPLGMLAVAATAHNVPHGMALMAGVGLGTAPGLVSVGLLGVGLDRKFRAIGMRAAGVLVVAIGVITIGRASGVISRNHPVNSAVPSCCCQEHKVR